MLKGGKKNGTGGQVKVGGRDQVGKGRLERGQGGEGKASRRRRG